LQHILAGLFFALSGLYFFKRTWAVFKTKPNYKALIGSLSFAIVGIAIIYKALTKPFINSDAKTDEFVKIKAQNIKQLFFTEYKDSKATMLTTDTFKIDNPEQINYLCHIINTKSTYGVLHNTKSHKLWGDAYFFIQLSFVFKNNDTLTYLNKLSKTHGVGFVLNVKGKGADDVAYNNIKLNDYTYQEYMDVLKLPIK
jgi:hypothetical protein